MVAKSLDFKSRDPWNKPGRVLKMFIKFREISKASGGEEMGVKTIVTEPTITSEYPINSGK